MKKIKVLIVDDSALIRKILSSELSKEPNFEIVGSATDPYVARDMILEHLPDVMTLDIEMPRMDGVAFLRKLMPQHPIPVVMVSSLTQKGKSLTLQALEAGAVDFVTKPTVDVERGLSQLINELKIKIRLAAQTNVSHWKVNENEFSRLFNAKKETSVGPAPSINNKIVFIGASTGGTDAVKRIVETFPVWFPPVVVVQHMPAGFTKMYAERLNSICSMSVDEAKDGDVLNAGKIFIAPGGLQLKVKRRGDEYVLECRPGPKENGHCPSVSTMFASVAEHVGKNAIGIILTGMGSDGAREMKLMKDQGSYNIAQSEKTCVVFGMPKVAIERGGIHEVLDLNDIGRRVMNYIMGNGTGRV